MDQLVFKSHKVFADPGSDTLVIACSSNSFAPYLREFLLVHLGLGDGTYDLLSVPGGPQFLMLSEYLPKFAWAGQRWVKFLVERHRLKRLIVVSHDDCAWYGDLRHVPALLEKLGVGSGSTTDRQRRDLDGIVSALHQLLPPVVLEAYFAEKSSDGFFCFHRLA